MGLHETHCNERSQSGAAKNIVSLSPVLCCCGCLQLVLPQMVPASLAFLRLDGAYLLDNGQVLVLWLGRDVPQAWLAQVSMVDYAALCACRD